MSIEIEYSLDCWKERALVAEAALDRVRSITVEEIAKAIHVAFEMHYLRWEATPSLKEMAEPVHRLLTERMEGTK